MRKKRKDRHLTAQAVPAPQPEPMQPTAPRTLQIGDIVIRRPITIGETDKTKPNLMRGKVVYIHPQGRFHVVEFGEGQYAIRESFMGVDR